MKALLKEQSHKIFWANNTSGFPVPWAKAVSNVGSYCIGEDILFLQLTLHSAA
jgi:hypothetical protein